MQKRETVENIPPSFIFFPCTQEGTCVNSEAEGAPYKWMVPFLINVGTDFPELYPFLNQLGDLYSDRIVRQRT